MIPLPNLDDRMFSQLVEDAKRVVRRLAPQWTDENLHDPGITFIELFAWLTEMQQFYMDQIGEQHYLKYLKLLGIKPREAVPAKAEVAFAGADVPAVLPVGTRVSAGRIPYETEDHLNFIPAEIDKVIIRTSANYSDQTSSNQYEGISYYAFGEEARKGNRFFIGFNGKLPENQEISLTVDLFNDYPAGLNSFQDGTNKLVPSGKVSFQYYGAAGWSAVEMIDDKTIHFSRSGRVIFKLPGEMSGLKIYPATDKDRFWLSCTLEEDGYEIPPRINEIRINTVSVVQTETLSKVTLFSGTGYKNQQYVLQDFLSCVGCVEIQVREENGCWRYWRYKEHFNDCTDGELCYILQKEPRKKIIKLIFGDGQTGQPPPEGQDNIRVISYLPGFAKDRWLGNSTGLPGQTFQLPNVPVNTETFRIQVGKKDMGSAEYIWEEWERVDSFDASRASDRSFTLDTGTGQVRFGDNINGLVPDAASENNISVISYQIGGGERGNVGKGLINGLELPFEDWMGLTVTNISAASGGADREPLDRAKIRAVREQKQRLRTVTSEDFEEIAQNTPGLRIARVKAIPMFAPGLKKYPENKAPGQVTVVVVPYSQSLTPAPSQGFMATVLGHLDKYRLVTTEIHVTGPDYIEVTVHSDIVRIGNQGVQGIQEKITDELNKYLSPVGDGAESNGWPFGRTVNKGDIYSVIKAVEGVDFIKELWLHAEGAGIEIKPNGDINIPPCGLVYSGRHQIQVMDREDI
jgi:hypothetical protein